MGLAHYLGYYFGRIYSNSTGLVEEVVTKKISGMYQNEKIMLQDFLTIYSYHRLLH